VLLSGGAQITGSATRNVAVQSSYPSSSSTWQTVAVVVNSTGSGQSATLHPYAICGKS
jgi:hypothetical protein